MHIDDHDRLRYFNNELAKKYGSRAVADAIDSALSRFSLPSVGHAPVGLLDSIYDHTISTLGRNAK